VQRACRSMSLTLDRRLRRVHFTLSGMPTGPVPVEFPRVFVRYARGAAAHPCRGRAIVQRLLDLNHALWCCHRIGQPLRLTRRRTPRRSPISRNFAPLAAKKRPSIRSPLSFSIWICQLWALRPSRSKISASSAEIEAFPPGGRTYYRVYIR
jgi:hypothetical protein